MAAAVEQFQILTQQPAKHAAFYKAVFGWETRDDNPLGYLTVESAPGGIAGGFWPAPAGAASFVQLYLRVPDVAAAVAAAVLEGGEILIPPQTLPQGERMAVLRDPMGMSFGVFSRGG